MNKPGLVIASMLMLTILLHTGCSDNGQEQHVHTHHADMPSVAPPGGLSVYQLKSIWTDQRGQSVRLSELGGRIVVLAMVYTHCDNACPRIIADMRLIRRELAGQADRIHFVLVSIDPERDTVKRLQSFGNETGLTEQGWTLLRGDKDDVQELAAVFGVKYRKISEQDYAHSNVISVLDQDGLIVHQQQGLGVRFDATVAAIRARLESGA